MEESRLSGLDFLLRTDCSQDLVSNKKDVGQCRRHEQAVAVLGQTAIAHLLESKHSLDHPDRVLDARADARLRPVLGLDRLINVVIPLALPIREVLAFGALARITCPWLLYA